MNNVLEALGHLPQEPQNLGEPRSDFMRYQGQARPGPAPQPPWLQHGEAQNGSPAGKLVPIFNVLQPDD